MPDVITIYRGCLPQYKKGISWTKSKSKATWFANRFKLGGKVFTATCQKSDVIAYKNTRGEKEVIINPKNLMFVE